MVWKLDGDATDHPTKQTRCAWHVVQRGLAFYVKPFAPDRPAFMHLYPPNSFTQKTPSSTTIPLPKRGKLLQFVSGWAHYMPRQNQRPQHVLGKDGDGVAASGTLKSKAPSQFVFTCKWYVLTPS